ncbi:MAG TPA: hypothetical protein VGL66_03125 [Caulobacteraceae bacterium]|jgi:hypothetical protein
MKLLHLLPSLFVLATLGACASDQPAPEPEHHHHRHDGGGPPGAGPAGPGIAPLRGGLFISPLGQPFRAPPGTPYPAALWFQTANTTHDGRLTRTQFRADAEAFFHALDQNHDGVIDASEISAYEHATPEIIEGFRPAAGAAPGDGGQPASGGSHHGRHGGGMGGGMGGGGYGGRGGGGRGGGSHSASQPADTKPQGAAWFSFLSIPEPVASADRNLDGKVTLQEFLETADARFDELDPDHAGYLSFDKLPKTPVQQPRRR